MATATKRRTAQSAVQTKRAEKQEAIVEKALEYHRNNADSNTLDNIAKAARKLGYQLFKAAGFKKPFDHVEGNCKYEIGVEAKEREVVDVHKLKKLVDEKTFMLCISASIKDVKTHAGKAVLDQVTYKVTGEENLYVKVKET